MSSQLMSTRALLLGLGVAAATFFEIASTAHAQVREEDIMATRLHLRGVLTAGGRVRLDVGNASADDNLRLGGGGAIELEAPLAHNFSLGGSATVTEWQTEAESRSDRRNIVADFDIVPRLRFPVVGNTTYGVLYVGVPLGVSVDFPNSDYSNSVSALGGNLSTGFGFHLGGRLGAQVFLTRRFGLVGEAGFDYRTMRHNIDFTAASDHFMLRMIHFTATAGFVISL